MNEAPSAVSLDLNGPVDALVDALDCVLERGVVLHGDLELGVAEVALVRARVRLYLQGVRGEREVGAPRVPTPSEGGDARERPGSAPRRFSSDPASPPPAVGAYARRPEDSSPADGEMRSLEEVPRPPLPKESAACQPTDAERSNQAAKGLAHLVVVLLDLVRRLLERQALRRLDGGDLSEETEERLGRAFAALEQQIDLLLEMLSEPHPGAPHGDPAVR
jgi:hypothetical protein